MAYNQNSMTQNQIEQRELLLAEEKQRLECLRQTLRREISLEVSDIDLFKLDVFLIIVKREEKEYINQTICLINYANSIISGTREKFARLKLEGKIYIYSNCL